MDTILDIQNVSKSYGDKVALEDVSLSIPSGSIYGLLGPNGAGKTTLIRIINRIIYADKGKILFRGQEMTDEDVYKVGYLPEERGLYADMNIGDQLVYFGQLKNMTTEDARSQVKFWFERLDIQDFYKKKLKELSKGMAQKVQFVLSVLHRPQLVVFDEVFSGFDPVNANLIKEQIFYLNDQGTTILFSSHRMENVEEMCTHAALIHNSHLVLNGEINDIRNQYREGIYKLRTQGEISLTPNEKFEVLENEKQMGMIRLHDGVETSQVLRTLIDTNDIVLFEEVIPSLNEIFVKIVSDE